MWQTLIYSFLPKNHSIDFCFYNDIQWIDTNILQAFFTVKNTFLIMKITNKLILKKNRNYDRH